MIKLRFIFHYIFYFLCPRKRLIEEDIDHYKEVTGISGNYVGIMCKLFVDRPEFRSVFYYRLGRAYGLVNILKFLVPPMPTPYIYTPSIGGGLFIQHGFATIICAKSIGRHCHINQQVTIGYKGALAPVLGDNVTVTCGAKILGGVKVEDNVVIGANAVVVKDVPANTIVAGVPAYIIRKNGEKVYEKL